MLLGTMYDKLFSTIRVFFWGGGRGCMHEGGEGREARTVKIPILLFYIVKKRRLFLKTVNLSIKA